MVAEAAAGPSQEEEARQASVQELQSLKDSLSQAESKTKELEAQLENINKVRDHKTQKLNLLAGLYNHGPSSPFFLFSYFLHTNINLHHVFLACFRWL